MSDQSDRDSGHRAEQTALSWEISRAFHSTHSLQPLLQIILQKVTQATGAEHCLVLLPDKEGEWLSLAAATASPRPGPIPLEGSVAGRVLRQGQARLVLDVAEEGAPCWEKEALKDLSARSILAVPLKSRDRTIGVLEIVNKQGQFDRRDISLASSIAEQAAVAIENALLLDTLKQSYDRLTEAESLKQEITKLPAHLSNLLSAIVKKAPASKNARGGVLWALDENRKDIVCLFCEGRGRELWSGEPLKIGEGIAGWVIAHARPLFIKDLRQSEWSRPSLQGPTSVVCSPLMDGERAFGAIALIADTPFGEEDAATLTRLAASIALVVKNLELHESNRKAGERQALLEEITQVFHSTVELDKLLPTIFEKVVKTIGAEGGSIWLLDKPGEMLECFVAKGGGGEALLGTRLKSGEGIVGWVTANKQPTIINNVSQDERHASHVDRKISFTTRSILSAPLITEGESLGAINVVNKLSGGAFVQEDQNLLLSLANNAALAIKNAQLVEELKEAERIRREIEIASRIQMSLLPRTPPKWKGLDLAGRCLPAQNVGGDYYDFFPTAGGNLGMLIADVSGHGIGSALMMATTRSTLRFESQRQQQPSVVLAQTAQAVYDDLSNAELFITVFYVVYNSQTRLLTWANGGHNKPILWRRREAAPTYLDADGMLIGILQEVDYEQRQMELEPGDVLVMYTDGVTEAKDPTDEMFGEERLCQVIEDNINLPASGLLDSIYKAVRSHNGPVPQYDDITAIVMKVEA